MREEILLQHKLQKAIWCEKGLCPSIHTRWQSLIDEIIANRGKPEIRRIVEAIIHQEHNIFGYPNKERGLWLELERIKYNEKGYADIVYFVGCKTSFLISAHQQAKGVLKELVDNKVDFAVLGQREWCCGMPLKRLGMNEEFKRYREHNIQEIQKLEAKKVIFSCPLCHSMWQKEYMIDGIELIYMERGN